MRRAAPFAALFCLLMPGAASAWGWTVHSLIGELAERQLSDAARREVRMLLVDEPEPSLAAVASWPDEIRRQPGWEWTAPMHYVKFLTDGCREVLPEDCRDGLCVYGAIERYRNQLADRSLSRRQRAEALKFVVHFVGDIHQPLHAGYRNDRGGNQFQVNLNGTGTNLHAVWDRELLNLAPGEVQSAADRLFPELVNVAPLPLHVFDPPPRDWATDSCYLIRRIGIYPPKPGNLPKGYLEAMRPHAEAQVMLAAVRLARLLEPLLGR